MSEWERGNLPDNHGIELSVVKIDLLSFFQANPYTIDNAAGLARRIHRPVEVVKSAIIDLARLGILTRYGAGSVPVYRLKHGEEIASFFAMVDEEQRRFLD